MDIHPIMLHRMVPAGEADTGTIMTAPGTNGTMAADGAIILQGRRKQPPHPLCHLRRFSRIRDFLISSAFSETDNHRTYSKLSCHSGMLSLVEEIERITIILDM